MSEPSATCSFEELIQSRLFTFYIGKEREKFVLHSKAIAATSWHFHALVNNGMAQSQEGSVEYSDMDPKDFARFVEYAYRCDYTVPSGILDETTAENNNLNGTTRNGEDAPPEAEEPEPEPEPVLISDTDEENSVQYRGLTKAQIRKVQKRRMQAGLAQETSTLRQRFNGCCYLMSHEPKRKVLENFLPQENTEPEQDFTPVFLAHARLYTFACMRLIDPLKRLTLHKLHQTLLRFKLYDRRVGDVVELARYAYDHGEDRKPDGTIEDLRKLVVEYIACEVSVIGKHQAFAPLLQDGGEFVVDFWRTIVKENPSL